VAEPVEAAPAPDGHPARSRFAGTPLDALIATLLALAVFVLHPLAYVLHAPLWLDEAWVADLARAPLSRALTLSSSTPIGWLLLVRLVPGGRGEQLRLVPLVFAAGEVAAAYVLGYCLPWGSKVIARIAGTTVALVVLLAPLSLVRNDLKQYTADAFFALVILALESRAEGAAGSRPVMQLAMVSVAATFFSTAAAFVVVAVFVGLFVAAIAGRATERIRTVGLVGAAVAVALGAYFAFVVVPHTSPSLRAYWDDFYLPFSPRAVTITWHRVAVLAPAVGLTAVVAAALFVLGCVMLARTGRPGLACALPVLWIEMFAVGIAHRYPFLDERTSLFLLVASLVPIAAGVLASTRLLWPRRRFVALSFAVVTASLFVLGSVSYVGARWLPREDVRGALAYIDAHRRPGDVVLVTLPSSFAFAYYRSGGRTEFVDDSKVSMGFVTRVAGLRDVVYATGLTSDDTTRALRQALAGARATSGARIWIVRSHLFAGEARAWATAFGALGVQPVARPAGAEPVWVVRAS
jgi:hypothetical protein